MIVIYIIYSEKNVKRFLSLIMILTDLDETMFKIFYSNVQIVYLFNRNCFVLSIFTAIEIL